jgi:hypothetical protein
MPQATAGLPGGGDALALMVEGLRDTTPTEPVSEPPADDGQPKADEKPAPAPSRRAKTVEKVLSAAEQKIADAEARATAAETKAAELEAKVTATTTSQTSEQETARVAALEAEYGGWIGTAEQYAEAERLALMDPDADGWDWDKHREAVNNLNAWKERRKWAGITTTASEQAGRALALAEINDDFLVTLAADLPEDKRPSYTAHPGGIPGAVRFYAETIYAPQLEAKDAIIAERDAEIERLRATSGGSRAPAMGGAGGSGPPAIDLDRMSPEEIMAHGLREQARANGRRR